MDQIVTPTQARKDLFKIIKRINENNEPVVIKPTRADEKSVVVIGEDDWKAIQETLFLVNHGVDKQIKERENEPLDDFDDVWGQLMSYAIKLKRSANKDLKKIKGSYLEKSFLQIIEQLRKDPLAPNQGFEKLVLPIKGFYSRRINIQHRLVYKVDQDTQTVIIYSAWSHDE